MLFSQPDTSRAPNTRAPGKLRLTLLVLRLVVFLQAFAYISQSLLGETAIFELLWLELHLSESTALFLTRGGALIVLASSLGLCLRRSRPLGFFISAWFALSAVAEMVLGGAPFLRIVLAADAIRILVPAALVLLPDPDEFATDARLADWSRRLLALGAGVTFIAHGWEALQHNPQFVDYLLLTSRSWLDAPLAESTALFMLTVIGVVDMLLGLLVLAGHRSRVVLGYMAAWGLITALARTVYGGIWAYPSTLVRTANGGGPLALLLLTLPEQTTEAATDEIDHED